MQADTPSSPHAQAALIGAQLNRFLQEHGAGSDTLPPQGVHALLTREPHIRQHSDAYFALLPDTNPVLRRANAAAEHRGTTPVAPHTTYADAHRPSPNSASRSPALR